MSYVSNGVQDPILNVTLDNKSLLQKVIANLKIFVAESPEDTEFKKEFVRMTIDHKQLLDGVTGSFVLRAFMVNFMSSLDSEVKFPLKQVIMHLRKGLKLFMYIKLKISGNL